jgi:predicted nucleotide-binding protein (sugar kinase/HSP70/actin superfamily)
MGKSKKIKKPITIGIPRALLYFKYAQLWENFFHTLDINYIVSPDTNNNILTKGINFSVDETCLSSKIFLGHVIWLMDKCDYIFVPRISNFGKIGTVCTKHQAIFDVVRSTFREQDVKLLHYNIDRDNSEKEVSAFVKLGSSLGKSKAQSLFAYWVAKQAQKTENVVALREQQQLLEQDKIKILIIAHRYNINDKYIGEPIMRMLRNLGTVPINGSIVDEKTAIKKSFLLSKTLPWVVNKELLGSIAEYRDRVDGIILMSSFPCGPDSMVNEIIIRRVKDKPILNLILDGQEGGAGLETRLESFVDIINFRRNDLIG